MIKIMRGQGDVLSGKNLYLEDGQLVASRYIGGG